MARIARGLATCLLVYLGGCTDKGGDSMQVQDAGESASASDAAPLVTDGSVGPLPDASSGSATAERATATLLPRTSDSYPFGAADQLRKPIDLAAQQYVEEEFVVRGRARTYDWAADGSLSTRTEPTPYATRVLVRRPAASAKFSGRVVVELLNPTNQFDLQIGWSLSYDQFMREGDAWVGITSKPVAVVALQNFDPKRYAELSWANALPASDPRNCAMVARDSSQATENGLVWDIFRQVGALVRSPGAQNLLGGLSAKRVYGFGYSQTGSFLATYASAFHAVDVRERGALFDGYLIGTSFGVTAVNQCATAPMASDPRAQLRNVGVPVFRVMTQSDYRAVTTPPEDGDTREHSFRYYEIAGAGHATPMELDQGGPKESDLMRARVPLPATECTPPGLSTPFPRSRFPLGMLFNALWRNLDAWVSKNELPPKGTPMARPDALVDEHGNARGGLRTPYVDVPTSSWFGNAGDRATNLICYLAGYEVPFDAAKLRTLYPTHADYVAKVVASANALVAERVLTREDADRIVAEAERAPIPPP